MDREGFRFEGAGQLLRRDVFETKTGKEIVTLVLEVQGGKFKQLIPIKLFGEQANKYADIPLGSKLRIRGNIGGREWQGKVFADITANEIQVTWQPQGKPSQVVNSNQDDDVLF